MYVCVCVSVCFDPPIKPCCPPPMTVAYHTQALAISFSCMDLELLFCLIPVLPRYRVAYMFEQRAYE